MESVTGDTVAIDVAAINPESRYICSNGVTYTYYDYTVPRDLYQGTILTEGEDLIDSIGSGRFAWAEFVSVSGYSVEPEKQSSLDASEHALTVVQLPRKYDGEYSVSFDFTNVFPMTYRLEWRASFRPSGEYTVFVNDEEVGSFDTFYLKYAVISVGGGRFVPNGVINTKDWLVENITEFGNVNIRFEYRGPGLGTTNGFNIDYAALVPMLD
jgi:hypothetical protein